MKSNFECSRCSKPLRGHEFFQIQTFAPGFCKDCWSRVQMEEEARMLGAQASQHFPHWRRMRTGRTRAIYGFVEGVRVTCIGVREHLAGVVNRERFWLEVARTAGPGRNADGEWADMSLGVRRLKWRWVRRLLRQL